MNQGKYDFSILQNNPIAGSASKAHVIMQTIYKTSPKTIIFAFVLGVAITGTIWLYFEYKKNQENEDRLSSK